MITDKIKARHLDESLLELINKPSISSWNDLTDRPFGETEAEVEKVYLDFNGDLSNDALNTYLGHAPILENFVLGESYDIIYNDTLYKDCIAKESSAVNGIRIDYKDEIVEISIKVTNGATVGMLTVTDYSTEPGEPGDVLNVSIKVTGKAKENIVKRLDGKYLPEGYPYVEGGNAVEILPETTLTEEQLQNDGLFYPSIIPDANKQYTVIWNGVAYITTAIEVTENDITGVVLGDAYTASNGAMGNSATGEPFCLVYYPAAEKIIAIVNALDGSTTVTLSIYQQNETIHTMDPKFLPLKFIEGSGAATDTLTFDGNLEGKEYFQAGEDIYFVHLSDTFVDSSELIGGTITITAKGLEDTSSNQNLTISEDLIYDMSEDFGFPSYSISEACIVLSQSSTEEGITFSSGIWIAYHQDVFYISELKAPKAVFNNGENILLLDPEYIKDMYYEKKEEEILHSPGRFSYEYGLS